MKETITEIVLKWFAILFLVLFGFFLSYSGLTGDDPGAAGFGMISVLVGVCNAIGAVVERNHKHEY